MSFTPADHKAICEAIAGGYRTVQYDGKKVEFQSTSELLRVKSEIEADLIARGLLQPTSVGGVQRGGSTFASYDPD